MPTILHLLKLSAVVTLDTGSSAEQDHHCLLEENYGQKLSQKSVYFLPVVIILKTSLSQLQIKLEKKTLQIRSHTRWRNWSGNEDLDKLFNEDNSEGEEVGTEFAFRSHGSSNECAASITRHRDGMWSCKVQTASQLYLVIQRELQKWAKQGPWLCQLILSVLVSVNPLQSVKDSYWRNNFLSVSYNK
jgi:hypothetical protein